MAAVMGFESVQRSASAASSGRSQGLYQHLGCGFSSFFIPGGRADLHIAFNASTPALRRSASASTRGPKLTCVKRQKLNGKRIESNGKRLSASSAVFSQCA